MLGNKGVLGFLYIYTYRICVSGFQDIVFATETDFKERSENQNNLTIDLDERNMTVFNRSTNEILLMRKEAMFFDVQFDGITQTIFEDKFIISSGKLLVVGASDNGDEYVYEVV